MTRHKQLRGAPYLLLPIGEGFVCDRRGLVLAAMGRLPARESRQCKTIEGEICLPDAKKSS